MYKIINKNSTRPYDVPVIHADGRRDLVQVMGPKRPVYLRVGMKPAPEALKIKDLFITEVSEPETAAQTEKLVTAPAPVAAPAPASAPAEAPAAPISSAPSPESTASVAAPAATAETTASQKVS